MMLANCGLILMVLTSCGLDWRMMKMWTLRACEAGMKKMRLLALVLQQEWVFAQVLVFSRV